MRKINIEDLKKEETANELYKEAAIMLQRVWKTSTRFGKKVKEKFEEVDAKLAEADALIPSGSEYKTWTAAERFLANAVAEEDPYFEKRFEIKKWFEYYTCFLNKQIINPEHFMVEITYNVLSDSECWNGPEIDRTGVAKKLMVFKRSGGKELHSIERYYIACQFCLEDDIYRIFDNIKEIGAMERFVQIVIGSNKLLTFWYYYANVINVENPDPEMVNKFKKLAGDIEDKQVLYRYGIDCALERGSKEAVEFFWNKLPNKDPHILIDAAIKTESDCYTPCNSYIVAFCVDQLDSYGQPSLFRELMKKDMVQNDESDDSYSHVMSILNANHFYKHMEKVIKHLNPSDFPETEYENLIRIACDGIVFGPRTVFDQAVNFLTWLWDLPVWWGLNVMHG